MKEKIIVVFDVGKTNKKLLLFNNDLQLVSQNEQEFQEMHDEDGFPCDDIDAIEKWIRNSVSDLVNSPEFDLEAVNFTTYGATLAYLDSKGKRLTAVYNYLKPLDESIPGEIYLRYGGKNEFCRRTASPALGMLNSGFQTLWLKKIRPDVFARTRNILHFPQYLSYCLTGKIYSEHTSIGCHTVLWDFDNMNYHPWVRDEGLNLPDPEPPGVLNEVEIEGKRLRVGIGIHDSSASLAPYFSGSKGRFLLVSTGTWCINMNPFNYEKLTAEQLARDCLCYLSINRKPVKSSRLFLGHLHDECETRLRNAFKMDAEAYKNIHMDNEVISMIEKKFKGGKVFFSNDSGYGGINEKISFSLFNTYIEGYHQLMVELTALAAEAIDLVIPAKDDFENIYITGGFSKNQMFLKMLAAAFPDKKVYSSRIDNASALGAAMVIHGSLYPGRKLNMDLDLKEWK